MLMTSAIVGMLLAGAPAGEAGWTQWRGPNRDGATTLLGGPWPAELERRWRTSVGAGQASPVVSGQTAFAFGREGGSEVATAVDLRSGRVLWRQGYAAPYDVYPGAASYGSGPRSTPVVHHGRLFTLGISGILTAFDAATGRIAWQKDFAGRFAAAAPPFGASMSPLVAAGRVIVHAGGHDGGALIAFDPATGDEAWTIQGAGPSYSSPVLLEAGGQQHLVIQVHREILGVEPRAGQVLWRVPFVTPCDQNIVTPLPVGGRVLVSSVGRGTLAIEPKRGADGWTAPTAWHTTDVSMYMSSPVLVRGRVLGLSHRKRGQFFALDPATGAVQWTSDAGQGENAAFVVAGDAALVLQADGILLVLPGDAPGFVPARRYRVSESPTYAHPVPTVDGILIKDEDGLALYARAPGRAAAGHAATRGAGSR